MASSRGRSRVRITAAALAITLVLASCGDDENSDASTPTTAATGSTTASAPTTAATGSTTAASVPTGKPKTIKVLVIAPEDTPASNLPDMRTGAVAAAKGLAEAGHPVTVEVEYCNDKADTNEATACARKASDGYSAILAVGRGVQPIFEVGASLGVPVFSFQLALPQAANPNYFAIDGGSYADNAMQGVAAVKLGYKKVAIVSTDVPATVPFRTAIRKGVESQGGTVVEEVLFPATGVTDYAPYVAQLRASGADAVCMIQTNSGVAALSQAMEQAGLDIARSSAGTLNRGDLARMGPLLDGLIIGSAFPPIDAAGGNADVVRYISELKAAGFDPDVFGGPVGLRSWATVQVIADVAAGLDKADKDTLRDALNSSGPIDVPVIGKWTPSAPGPALLPRYSNMAGYAYQFHGTTPKLVLDKPFVVADLFKS